MAKRDALSAVPETSPGSYGALIEEHVRVGTRPGTEFVFGTYKPWMRGNKAKFAEAMGVTDRSLRGWIAGSVVPNEETHKNILIFLFGTDPGHAAAKAALDAAYLVAKQRGRTLEEPSARRLPGIRTERVDHPALIGTLILTLRASNDEEIAFYVESAPNFDIYKTSYQGIGLEIGVRAARLNISAVEYEFVPYSELGGGERAADVRYGSGGWLFESRNNAPVLFGHVLTPADGYIVAMRLKDTPADGETPPAENVRAQLTAHKDDFVITALLGDHQAKLDKEREAVLRLTVLDALAPDERDAARVTLSTLTANRAPSL